MSTLQGSYLTVAEADAVVEHRLLSVDERRTSWDAMSDADKAVLLRQATSDLDACNWLGEPTDEEQGLAWPRVHSDGTAVGGAEGTSPAVVTGVTAWGRAGVPGEILFASAIQAARLAFGARGLDDGALTRADAQRGVSGRSGGSGSVSIDLGRAGSPLARLDPDAAAHARLLMAWGGDLA